MRLRNLHTLALAAAALGFTASSHALTLTRGPYLGRPNDSDVTIIWRTDQPAAGSIRYGTARGEWKTIEDPSVTGEHRVVLTGLVSGVSYDYAVTISGVTEAVGSFTAPMTGRENQFSFGVIGDTDGAVTSSLATSLAAENTSLVLHTGDVVYPRGAEADYDPKFFVPFAPLLRQTPILPTLGNHDVKTGRGVPLLNNFVLPKNPGGTSRYYALRQGNALFICLDVETSPYGYGSEQYRWLESLLQAPNAIWTFVWLHEPPYSSGTSNNILRLVLSPLFEHYGVDLVFSGHEHFYERTLPIHDFVPAGRGVVYLTVGGGGAGFTVFQKEDYCDFVEARLSYVTARIDGTRLTVEAHDPDGTVFDSVVLQKDSPAPARVRTRGVRRPR